MLEAYAPGRKKPPAILSQGARLRISDNFADCVIRAAMLRARRRWVKGTGHSAPGELEASELR